MKMSARVARAWERLAHALHRVEVDDHFVGELQEVYRAVLPAVSVRTREFLAEAFFAKRLLASDITLLPMTHSGLAFARALVNAAPLPRDPLELGHRAERIAERLTVYVLPDDGCPRCQSDLGVYVTCSDLVLHCELGCTFSATLSNGALVPGCALSQASNLRPADRAALLDAGARLDD